MDRDKAEKIADRIVSPGLGKTTLLICLPYNGTALVPIAHRQFEDEAERDFFVERWRLGLAYYLEQHG